MHRKPRLLSPLSLSTMPDVLLLKKWSHRHSYQQFHFDFFNPFRTSMNQALSQPMEHPSIWSIEHLVNQSSIQSAKHPSTHSIKQPSSQSIIHPISQTPINPVNQPSIHPYTQFINQSRIYQSINRCTNHNRKKCVCVRSCVRARMHVSVWNPELQYEPYYTCSWSEWIFFFRKACTAERKWEMESHVVIEAL